MPLVERTRNRRPVHDMARMILVAVAALPGRDMSLKMPELLVDGLILPEGRRETLLSGPLGHHFSH